jgi:hypothetical protein
LLHFRTRVQFINLYRMGLPARTGYLEACMRFRRLALAGALSAAALIGAAAHAQTIANRTSDYTLSFNPATFGDASESYSQSLAYPAQSAFSGSTFTEDYLPDASNITFQQGGGISISETPVVSNQSTITIAGDGTAGFWGTTYNTTGNISTGMADGLNTLTFTGGGAVTNAGTIGYYIFVYLPGNWTTPGTSTGDYTFNGVGADFSTPTFTYNAGVTTVESFTTSYNSNNSDPTNLSFTLYGAAVPEPATWLLMLLGTGAVGAAMRIANRKDAMALTLS